jgi:heme-degrading monooxygenase HmoA
MACKEIVVYTVNEGALARLAEASASMDAFLATRPGFIRRVVLRDASVPRRFTDLVDWASLEEAQQASLAAENEKSVEAFVLSIETIVIASHFQ